MQHETRCQWYMEEADHSSSNQTRSSHNIGRLGNLIRENDEFFELLSSKFLSESRYSISIRAAAARVLLGCSLSWMYPHVFEDDVTENIKNWVLDDSTKYSSDDGLWKRQFGEGKCSDFDMLKTYSAGLLALCLTSGSQVVEDVLTSGLSAKLMRYLRNRVLGETSSSHKDPSHVVESKSVALGGGGRGRDENRSRLRPPLETASLDDSRIIEDAGSADLGGEKDHDRSLNRQVNGEERWVNGEPADRLTEEVAIYDADIDGDDRWHGRDMHDGRLKTGERNGPGRSLHDEDYDESTREDSARRRVNRGLRSRGKARVNETTTEPEQLIMSPGSGSRGGQLRSARERNSTRNVDGKRVNDNKKSSSRTTAEGTATEAEDTDEFIQECRVGSKDISDLVKAAVRAAEAEARAANAPIEAVKAAGEDAAELVKLAALDVFKTTNDEEAAFLAASKAASTVIDAANAIEVSRNLDSVSSDLPKDGVAEAEGNEDLEFFIPDCDTLAQQREKFCIQCLVLLGEYVEVLGPVLHEKGVDVCLALLLRHSRGKKESEILSFLPDVLKLICALAAHRKFAAVFVDRGGIQKLLAVPRVLHTFFGLSSCLFTIGSLQGIMERVCALPSDVIYKLVELGLQLLECPQDQARKNAALFFAAAFVFRAVLDVFDAQDGLQKSLGLLHDAASVRSGVNSGTLGASTPGALRNDRSNADVLTSSEKQIAYHTCVALRQYFRAQLLLLVDTVRPSKSNRSVARHIPSIRAGYKPLDISNEAMDAVFLQIQKDRKLGPALVRARWPAVERFLACNGHVTMLELCQAPPVERYLHDLLQYALGILHIVTLVPYSRKLIVNATSSNDRVGIAVILDAANGPGYIDPDIIQQALNVLINLVCPPPSISNKSPLLTQNQQPVSVQTSNTSTEARDRNAERNVSDRVAPAASQIEARERNGESSTADRGSSMNNAIQSPSPNLASGLVGDRRISLGVGAGCAGLAAQLEQGYRQAREAVRSNNGIKVLLQLLQTRVVLPPATLDCLRALAVRVLLGLARDDTIAQILTKLQVGKKLSEVIRDLGNQNPGSEQNRWQTELTQAAIELIAIVTNSGRASTLAATDAATPTLRRIERAAIAAATPIAYHSRELLLLMHEHLQACGLSSSAATLMKEAQLTPLPSLSAPSSLSHHASVQEMPSVQIQWPSGRSPGGFLNKSKMLAQNEELQSKYDSAVSLKKKPFLFSSSFSARSKGCSSSTELQTPTISKAHTSSRRAVGPAAPPETPLAPTSETAADVETHVKTPIVLPMKRKLTELKEVAPASSAKRLNASEHGLKSPVFQTPNSGRRGSLLSDLCGSITPNTCIKDLYGRQTPLAGQVDNFDDSQYNDTPFASSQPWFSGDLQPTTSERLTLDSIVVQYLKHQHRQCPAPITTLPPLSLLHSHVCPEPRRSLDAPSNVTARISTREFRSMYGGIHGSRKDRQFVYSRFRPWRTCRDDAAALLTCMTFLGDSSQIAAGSHSGELKIFDSNSNNIVETCTSHQTPLVLVQSCSSNGTPLVLSSSSLDVKLWDASSISGGPTQTFEGCRAARFGNAGTHFAALPSESSQREILLFDVATHQMDQKFLDASSGPSGRGHAYSIVHFNPSDTMLLWNGVLWDRRVTTAVHRFDQFTDYGGGGFHPAGNEVIINSEVWDLRKYRLLRSVPSLDQTVITFNSSGDVIYAILRRNLDDIMSSVHTRRCKHPLFSAFRTLDAVNYSDIATIPVDRCVLDFATEPTDSFVGLVTMDDQDEMFSSARVYEIGRRRPPDDDSDPDDVESEDEDDDDDEDDVDLDPILGSGLDGDGDSDGDDMSNDDSVTDIDDDDEDDGDFLVDDANYDVGGGILEIVTEGDEDDDDSDMMGSFSSGDEFM
ncbi:DDB1- and CUL4-associated factor homolog 1 isoform X3 [Beta vulgaris subsp. vulgaris]|uniref:DDB1- and CUL4-associated factor homolog 1 isoform X3 n=1 Tax=Beta vulgaris subsp. vulgaris TaxID=3555 RepID=UPI002036C16D|nr:DDB1- and CUL4-associated factor homolog 1 isoform X3 [Beta vulgaris subsp. vulgaris]